MATSTSAVAVLSMLFLIVASDGENTTADLDDECQAWGDGGCALNALQRRGAKVLAAMEAEAESQEKTWAWQKHNNAALAELGVHFNASGMEYDLMRMGAPSTPTGYDGKAWPNMIVTGAGPHHAFAIGDWGGMDGSFKPPGKPWIIVYRGGHSPGPHVFPRNRWNKQHSRVLCDHKPFVECYASQGYRCPYMCGFVRGVDDKAQLLVAHAFNQRARWHKPKFVLNVGDNFYYGGLEVNCGTPMGSSSVAQTHQFNTIFNGVYSGAAPWLSALGNHDYGGFVFTNGWDQQIAYTWKSGRWVMPASYFSQHISFPDAGFTVDVYVVDSNHNDAKSPGSDPEHNLCSSQHNQRGASCPGGPPSVSACPGWFHSRWAAQQQWLSERLSKSTADWQIAVSHFPCDHDTSFWRLMHSNFGLDLLVTGHRHDQELWSPKRMGGLTCFITGGGGGISSEASPSPYWRSQWYGEAQYGFYDLTISKATILLESINYDGRVAKKALVYPKALPSDTPAAAPAGAPAAAPAGAPAAAPAGAPAPASRDVPIAPGPAPAGETCTAQVCGKYVPGRTCQCNSRCADYGNCCGNFKSACAAGAAPASAPALAPASAPALAPASAPALAPRSAPALAPKPAGDSCALQGCGRYVQGKTCQCNSKCGQYRNCCGDYASKCAR